ncbi:hypothetical protein KCU87_g196, partial [Aureobasidium melanogenum]
MALSSQREGAPGLDSLPPELQQDTFSYLDGDDASLFAVIQVSKAFHNFCIGMLWRKSTRKRLDRILGSDRRQNYANLVYDLDLNHDPSSGLLDGIEFPSLNSLTFRGGPLSKTQLHHCLHMRLQTLRLRVVWDGPDAALLELVRNHCTQLEELEVSTTLLTCKIARSQFAAFVHSFPKLRCLRLHSLEKDIMDETFAWTGAPPAQLEELLLTGYVDYPFLTVGRSMIRNKFLEHCTGLRKLHLDGGEGLSAETLTQLSCRNSLEVLYIDGWLSDYVGGQLQAQLLFASSRPHPFPSIRTLSLQGLSSTVITLLSGAPSTLLDLGLKVDDDIHSICPTISSLPNLVRLSISFDFQRELLREDLDLISNLSKLEKCHIERREPEHLVDRSHIVFLDVPWLTDEYFESWIAKFPQMRDLCLALNKFTPITLTQSCLQSLIKSCPLLKKCQLLWEHDLDTWRSLGTLCFNKLEILHLGRVKDHDPDRSQVVINDIALRDVKMIRTLAPELKVLSIKSERLHERSLTCRSVPWYEHTLVIGVLHAPRNNVGGKLSSFCDDSSTSLLLGYIFVQKEKRYVSLFESEIGRKGTIKESRREDHEFVDIQVEHDRAAIIGWYRGARSRWFGKASAALGSEDCDIEEQVNDGVVIWFRYACVERPQDFWAAMDSDRGEVAFSHLGQWKFWGSWCIVQAKRTKSLCELEADGGMFLWIISVESGLFWIQFITQCRGWPQFLLLQCPNHIFAGVFQDDGCIVRTRLSHSNPLTSTFPDSSSDFGSVVVVTSSFRINAHIVVIRSCE